MEAPINNSIGNDEKTDNMIEQIKRQIAYHKEQEDIKAKNRDYKDAIYHNNRLGALEDLLIWDKLVNKKQSNN